MRKCKYEKVIKDKLPIQSSNTILKSSVPKICGFWFKKVI